MSINLGKKNKILIVEPSDETRELLKEIFKKNNFDVLESVDGAEGLAVASNEDDLGVILISLIMPRIGGREFLKRIKRNKALKDIPVVIYDNPRSRGVRESMLSAGAKDFISKGTIAPDELVQRVARAMRQGDYLFEIDPYALDAQSFISDHHLKSNFKCTNCGGDLAMKITVDKNQKMKASIGCQQCGRQYL